METSKIVLRFIYSLLCYAAGVASLVYFILFVSDFLLGKTVNSIGKDVNLLRAFTIDLLLLTLFGLQHSVMARGTFKRWLTRFVHPSIERSTFVLATALVIGTMGYLWVPFGHIVWQAGSETAIITIRTIAIFGWFLLLTASFLLNHFELFGLRQTFDPLVGRTMPPSHFKTPGLYKIIRHPIQTGVLIGIWAVPVSTSSHLLFAGGMTVYIFIGLYFEEKDLLHEFKDSYSDYMKRVKRVIPFVL